MAMNVPPRARMFEKASPRRHRELAPDALGVRTNGVDDAALALVCVRDLEDAVAGDGHLEAVVQGDVLHGRGLGWFVELNSRYVTAI